VPSDSGRHNNLDEQRTYKENVRTFTKYFFHFKKGQPYGDHGGHRDSENDIMINIYEQRTVCKSAVKKIKIVYVLID